MAVQQAVSYLRHATAYLARNLFKIKAGYWLAPGRGGSTTGVYDGESTDTRHTDKTCSGAQKMGYRWRLFPRFKATNKLPPVTQHTDKYEYTQPNHSQHTHTKTRSTAPPFLSAPHPSDHTPADESGQRVPFADPDACHQLLYATE